MLPGVGVFGTGLTARVIVPLLKAEGFAVKALWGRTPEEAEELAKEMSVPFYTSRIDEVLLHQDVDLVCVNLPPPLTRQVAVKTLGEWGQPGGAEGGVAGRLGFALGSAERDGTPSQRGVFPLLCLPPRPHLASPFVWREAWPSRVCPALPSIAGRGAVGNGAAAARGVTSRIPGLRRCGPCQQTPAPPGCSGKPGQSRA